MGRKIMGGDFRAISQVEPVAAEPQTDPRLALVDLFRDTQVFRPEGHDPDAPLPEGAIDLSAAGPVPVPTEMLTAMTVDLAEMDIPVLTGVFEEDSQEATGEPEQGADDSAAQAAPEPADEAPADAEQDEKAEAPKQEQDEQDYDPIAAVLG